MSIRPVVVVVVVTVMTACSSGDPIADRVFPAGPLVERSVVACVHAPLTIELFDLDADGALDVIVGGDAVDVMYGDGAGGFVRAPGAPYAGPVAAEAFAFGDFDEDGRVDIAAAEHHEEPRFFVFLAGEDRGFAPSVGSPFTVDATPHLHTMAAGDLDTDGHLDLVTDSWPESRVVVVAGRGDGTFVTPGTQIEVPSVPIQNLLMADLNGDGRPDVVTPAHEHQAVTVLLGDGAGGFDLATGAPFASFGGFSRVVLGDVDGDGDTDVVELHQSDQSTEFKQDALSTLLNDGQGRLTHGPGSPNLDLSGRASAVALGDVDGDGRLDAVALSERTRVVALFRGGDEGFRLLGVHPAGERPWDVAAGDLDGDGRAEVLVTDVARGVLMIMGTVD